MTTRHTPPRIVPLPDTLDAELEPLLSEPFASAWEAGAGLAPAAALGARSRLIGRVAASRAAAAGMVTTRTRRKPAQALAPGATRRLLYTAETGRALRPGEPLQAWLIDLQPGAAWIAPPGAQHREWLVLRGRVRLGGEWLASRDYHVGPAAAAAELRSGDEAARVFLRESMPLAGAGAGAVTVRDAEAGWPAYAPGIRRRVLWQHGGQAALLYSAEPGATVPMHAHGHDEECLMVQGDLFLDDVLLQEGDYQLAPAGSGHRITETDTGAVIYAHGDLDLAFVT